MGLFGKEEPGRSRSPWQPAAVPGGGTTKFYTRQGILHGAAASLFNLEWTSPSCTCMICGNCGYVHWFFPGS